MPLSPKERGVLQKKIRQWTFAETEEPLVSLILGHVNKSTEQVDRIVNRWKPDPATGAWGDPEGVLEVILEEADDDAKNAGGGKQFYNLEARFGSGALLLSKQFSTTVTITDEADDRELSASMGPSEKVEPRGLVAMAMRMANERNNDLAKKDAFIEKLLHTTILGTLEVLKSENASLRARAEADEARRVKMRQIEEDLYDRRAERARKEQEESFKQEIQKEALTYVKFLVPVVANYLAGDKILPENTTPEAMGMGAFFDTVDSAAWQQALSCFPMPHQLFLNAMLKKHLDEKEKKAGTFAGDRPLLAENASSGKN